MISAENTPPGVPLLEARDLVKEYGASRVVDRVSLTLHRGETLGLVGESGSGKSTVARMILRLIEPTSGEVRLFFPDTGAPGRDSRTRGTTEDSSGTIDLPGAPHLDSEMWETGKDSSGTIDLLKLRARELRRLRRKLAMVFQDPYAALDPRMTVRQILAEPFAIHRERPAQGIDARLRELLAEVGLDEAALTRYPHQFSGGQRQRINIARALALRPELLVLDEPVSALDVSVGAQVINLLRDLQRRYGMTCLFISHSMPLVRYLCDRIVVMQRGRVVETGSWQQVCEAPREAYTQQLLAATPELPIACA